MARTRSIWLNLVFVQSLLVENPTAVERTETTAAEPAPGVTTRARSRRIAAATAALPEEILVWEIFVRLPANDILRCRAVCRRWRGLTSATDFLLAHHWRQPPLLLLTQRVVEYPDPIFEGGHVVLGISDRKGIRIHASCDGLLLISLSDGSFSVCNPSTRQCAPLPCLTTAAGRHINTAALYLHHPSGEYRVLYSKWIDEEDLLEAAAYYYILMVRQGHSPRCIEAPPPIDKTMMACSREDPPVLFRNCLHWETCCRDAGILVFDTAVESFRLMRRPDDANRSCTRLCDMDGSIGFSCFGDGRTAVKIWVLVDYERVVWSLKYHVEFEFPVGSFCDHEDIQHLVLSHMGDVLVYSRSYSCMHHFDNTGKLLEYWHSNSVSLIGPWFKESLVKHDFFPRQGCAWVGQPRFFE